MLAVGTRNRKFFRWRTLGAAPAMPRPRRPSVSPPRGGRGRDVSGGVGGAIGALARGRPPTRRRTAGPARAPRRPRSGAECGSDGARIDPQPRGTECHGPPHEDHEHRDVHRIARDAIQPDGDEAFGRRPRRQAAPTGDVEVAYAPEEQHDPEVERQEPDHPEPATYRAEEPRHQERDDTGHGEEGNDGTPEQASGLRQVISLPG
jgi:hypothetical protein